MLNIESNTTMHLNNVMNPTWPKFMKFVFPVPKRIFHDCVLHCRPNKIREDINVVKLTNVHLVYSINCAIYILMSIKIERPCFQTMVFIQVDYIHKIIQLHTRSWLQYLSYLWVVEGCSACGSRARLSHCCCQFTHGLGLRLRGRGVWCCSGSVGPSPLKVRWHMI